MGLVACLLFALVFFVAFGHGSALLPRVPAIYVFGDSTADVGNNNYLKGVDAKADYPHYGIDLPNKTPTGRFSNGYIAIDYLAMHMGFRRSPPPYLSLTNRTSHEILIGLRGANFASGGSGILDTTGNTITMTKQIDYFAEFKSHFTILMKLSLSKSIFIISSGGNDLFDFFSHHTSPGINEIKEFITTLLSKYEDHIKALYGLGARKFLLIDTPPVGCLPYARTLTPTRDCVDALNAIALSFNNEVKVLMSKLSSTLPGLKYSIGSSYRLTLDAVDNPGHLEVKLACCGSGILNAQVRCNQNTTYCADRSQFVFWDMLHPTQITGERAGLAFYSGPVQFASPISAKQLVEARS